MNNLKFFKRRNFLYGSLSTVITVCFIAAIVLVNFGLYQVFEIFPLKLDLTTQQSYAISSDTKKFLKTIKNDVQITVIDDGSTFTQDYFSSNSTLNPALQELKQYTQLNHQITLNFIDINKNPAFAAKYSTESFTAGDILIVSGTKHKKINAQDLFVTTTDQTTGSQTVTGNQTEQTMDSSLLFVTSSVTPSIAFTTGHKEQDATELQTLLTNNNYDSQTYKALNISTQEVNSAISVIAIVSPTVDFSAAEIEKLDAFLNNNDKYGKNVMVFLDPSQPSLPNLEAFMEAWGIQTQTGTVYDSSSTSPLAVPASTINSDYSGSIASGIPTYFPNSKSLKLLFTSKDSRTTTAIVQSSATSALWIQKDASDQFKASDSDAKGPFTLMAVCTKSTYDTNNVLMSSSVLVSASTQAIAYSGILSTTSYNNGSAVVGIFNKLVGVKSGISVVAKSMTASKPNPTATQTFVIKMILAVVIPLLVIALGIFMWLRRRHK
jgi:ABC-2 type transport system permease protein